MKNKGYVVLTFFLVIIYIGIKSLNYMVEYRIQEYEAEIEELEKEIDEIYIKENLSLSRENARETYKLELNNNIYYLEEENEE